MGIFTYTNIKKAALLHKYIKENEIMKLMIGENLRRLRREKDITQEQLAEILSVSYQSVSRWENGVSQT